MELAQLSVGQLVVVASAIAGATELLTRLRARDYWVVATIVTAAVLGALLALYYSAGAVEGAIAGLSASGLIKGLSSVGNKSTPAPSKVLEK